MSHFDISTPWADLAPPGFGPDFFGVSRATWYRWRRHDAAPLMARRLALLVRGHLGAVSDDWAGFCLGTRGPGHSRVYLWTPEGEPRTPGDVRVVPMLWSTIRAQAVELREARRPRPRPAAGGRVISFPAG